MVAIDTVWRWDLKTGVVNSVSCMVMVFSKLVLEERWSQCALGSVYTPGLGYSVSELFLSFLTLCCLFIIPEAPWSLSGVGFTLTHWRSQSMVPMEDGGSSDRDNCSGGNTAFPLDSLYPGLRKKGATQFEDSSLWRCACRHIQRSVS